RSNLSKINKNRRKGEYFLTDIVEILYNQGDYIASFFLEDGKEIMGINTQADLQVAAKIMRYRVVTELITRGVSIVDPETTFISQGVKVGKNTVIYPFTYIEEGVIIGRHCRIGPFIHIRKGSRIADKVLLGNFLEINRSSIGNNTKVKHFSYIGDAFIKENVNIGAGTVIANYDGRNKHKTFINKGAFIGSDTVLVAPVTIGKDSVTGAGSVVTKDVKAGQIVVGVPARAFKKKR
ncbi:MAG: bifunctional UDP-N-acetylglucosamine diphosphorylase/glucosamine-1-phosphate N-acetyltransferase GlmU, partial [Candidatus Omnitrophica bacterium]|nr:bifunctional UDP-N-acetylglucosamine diphosphorylase/glucosamine-1-phosphate N-acetyltransferase GlmU [Candidatus Omnitrophota bacterium]